MTLFRRGAWAAVGGLSLACSSSGTVVEQAVPHDAACCDAALDALAEADGAAADSGTAFDATRDGSEGGADASRADAAGATLVSLTVSTGTLVPPFDPAVTDYEVTSLDAVYPIEVTATASDPGAALLIHHAPASSGVPASFQLQPGEDFTVALGARTYTVHYLPHDLPAYTVSISPGAGTEDILLTPSSRYQAIVARNGDLLYYRTFPSYFVLNFQQFSLPGGTILYGSEVGVAPMMTSIYGTEHLVDAQFHDVGDLQPVAYDGQAALPAEGHDFILIDQGHYVAMSYVQRTVDLSNLNPAWSSQALVLNAVVQEVVAGTPVFEWDSGNVLSLYAASVTSNTFQAGMLSDYLHMNSMCIDPADGNFVLSFRNTSSIVKVDRTSGQILWTLGGTQDQFGLTGSQVFAFQHYVRVQPDGSLWVFDNAKTPPTRILSFVLDEVNKRVVSFTDVYDEPSTQPQASIMGSYAVLGPSRLLFGWGASYSQMSGPAVTEVSAGSVVWSLAFTDPTAFSYRALPIGAL